MRVNNFIFSEDSAEKTKNNFLTFLGDKSKWLGNMLYSLKEDWIDKDGNITDILIRENKPIYIASIKSYIPYFPKSPMFRQHDKQFPNREDINSGIHSFIKQETTFVEEGIIDFSFFVMGLGIFRVSASHDNISLGMSIRYLNYNIPTFSETGYPAFYTRHIENLIMENRVKTPEKLLEISSINTGGLILHVGATGSGKTTSIATEIGYIAENTTGAIITYENPIEYRFIATKAPVRQFEIDRDIRPKKGQPVFETIKRHLLRNNPSVVLVGEARDDYEIKAMLDFSARGHLVFGTIHASNVKEALITLLAVSRDEPYLVANTIQAIVAHKLVTSSTGDIIPLFEILIPNNAVRTKIAQGNIDQINKLFYIEKQLENSMTFGQSLDRAMKDGKISREEAISIKASNIGLFVN